MFFFLFLFLTVASQCDVATEVVPVSDVDSIVLQPYTCAAVGGAHWFVGAESKLVTAEKYDAAGGIAFIVCKLVRQTTLDWQCYAKTDHPDTVFYVTQPLSCVYSTENNVTMLNVGTCSLHFGLTTDLIPWEHLPYVELSIRDTLSFRPFLNLNAIGAVQRQTGVNKIIKVSDTYLDTVFLPPFPETATTCDTCPAQLATFETQLKTLEAQLATNYIYRWVDVLSLVVPVTLFFFVFCIGCCTKKNKQTYRAVAAPNQELTTETAMVHFVDSPVLYPIEEKHIDPV